MITSAQIRAGRLLLSWSPQVLAARTKLGLATIRRSETTDGDGEPMITMVHADAIRRGLEAAGVEFTNGGEPGVKLVAVSLPKLPRRKKPA
jgi:hypothetical protein